MERKAVDIVQNIKAVPKSPGLEASYLNMIIRKVYALEVGSVVPDEILCHDNEEAKSFYLSLILEAPIKVEDQEKILASFGLLEGFKDDENLTERRLHYLAEREEYDPSFVKDVPFKELTKKQREYRADGINRLVAYRKLSEYFNDQPDRLGYIKKARKKHIRTEGNKTFVVLIEPSYKKVSTPPQLPDIVLEPEASTTVANQSRDGVAFIIDHDEAFDLDFASPKALSCILSRSLDSQISQLEKSITDDSLYQNMKEKLTRHAVAGEMDSQLGLGILYFGEKQYKEAEHWWQVASNNKSKVAKGFLSLLYLTHPNGDQGELAFQYAKEATLAGDAFGCYLLGHCYNAGIFVPKDYKKAVLYYECVLNGKGPSGQNLYDYFVSPGRPGVRGNAIRALARNYEDGLGVKQNYLEVLRLYKLAFDEGDVSVAEQIARFYLMGHGVEVNNLEAFKWLYLAAKNNNSFAMGAVGLYYLKGEVVRKDYHTAKMWLEKAVSLGDSYAKYYLGLMFIDGDGVEKDEKRGLCLIRESASEDCLPAKEYLNEHGIAIGTPLD